MYILSIASQYTPPPFFSFLSYSLYLPSLCLYIIDRCFFFNRRTKESAWSLDEYYILKNQDINEVNDDNETIESTTSTIPDISKQDVEQIMNKEDKETRLPFIGNKSPKVRSKSSFFAHVPSTPAVLKSPSGSTRKFFHSLSFSSKPSSSPMSRTYNGFSSSSSSSASSTASSFDSSVSQYIYTLYTTTTPPSPCFITI